MNEELTDEQILDLINKMDPMNSYSQNLSDEPEKLSNSTHEIVFNITANILEENQKGEKVRSKKICTKYYHIPVPIDGDSDIFMKTFFNFLEEALASAASKTYQETNPYKDNEKNTDE